MSASCSCGGFTLKQKTKRDGLALRFEWCGACGRCDKFTLWAQGIVLTRGEVARRAFGDEHLTERLVSLARRRLAAQEANP
jgi:hypothetical protein